MSWIPFGADPRKCIGSRFGLRKTTWTIVTIFRSYKFILPERTEPQLQLISPSDEVVDTNGYLLTNPISSSLA